MSSSSVDLSTSKKISDAVATALQTNSSQLVTLNHYQHKPWKMFFMELSIPVISIIGFGILSKYLYKHMGLWNHEEEQEKQHAEYTKQQLEQQLRASGRFLNSSLPPTNRYEQMIMNDVIFPHQIDASFDDIGGMEEIKESIIETVILPLQSPELFQAMNRENKKSQHPLLSAPRGVLFYGPPGTGKTMMAKAIAKSCAATFINVRSSTLQNKWYGESQKMVRAIFSLAVKFAPSIIFIDEIDGLMRRRGDNDHEVTNLIKGEFMALWDGLMTDHSTQVTVLGCTNRPFDIDKAILRRLPRTFLFDLPDSHERHSIIKILLRDVKLASTFNMMDIVNATDGYSGSDLRELCRYAAMLPVRELLKQQRERDRESGRNLTTTSVSGTPRPIDIRDFKEALLNVQPTGKTSYEYQKNFLTQEQKQASSLFSSQHQQQQQSQQDTQAAAAMALGLALAAANVNNNINNNNNNTNNNNKNNQSQRPT